MSTSHQRSSSSSSHSTKRNGKGADSPAVPPQSPAPLPAIVDHDGWSAHWKTQGQPWRTEQEIDAERQKELEARRAIIPDIEKGIYPFSGMKLNRADVEWLLATHENGRGPVDWNDQKDLHERRGIDVRGADLRYLNLNGLPLSCMRGGLEQTERNRATEEQREMAAVHLEGASLVRSHLERAELSWAHLEKANLFRVHLQRAALVGTHLEKSDLGQAHMQGAYLEGCHLNDEQGMGPRLVSVHWENANLAGVKWSQITMLADEYEASQKRRNGKQKSRNTRLLEFELAVRANRQLAVALQEQGLNEDAGRFAYRAQVLQKTVFRCQIALAEISVKQRLQMLGAWFFSWFLYLIAGYGYKPGRSFLAYFLTISGFATAYYFLGHFVGPTLSPLGAFVFSMTSFHGRGFFPGNNISLDDPLTVLAALEALVGLIIEVTFIATLTQRFFNR